METPSFVPKNCVITSTVKIISISRDGVAFGYVIVILFFEEATTTVLQRI
jgi:hypothetical protein